MKKKRKPLTVTVINPEAESKAGDKCINFLYELYIKSLSEKKKED